jgi:hypothetical protein
MGAGVVAPGAVMQYAPPQGHLKPCSPAFFRLASHNSFVGLMVSDGRLDLMASSKATKSSCCRST